MSERYHLTQPLLWSQAAAASGGGTPPSGPTPDPIQVITEHTLTGIQLLQSQLNINLAGECTCACSLSGYALCQSCHALSSELTCKSGFQACTSV